MWFVTILDVVIRLALAARSDIRIIKAKQFDFSAPQPAPAAEATVVRRDAAKARLRDRRGGLMPGMAEL